MKSKKYYAIKRGYNTGIFCDIDYAKLQIYKYKNAKYKMFKEKNLALKYLICDEHDEDININDSFFDVVAYTDGSYVKNKNIFTFGAVLFYQNKKIEFYEKFNNKKWSKLENAAGEIMGVVKVIDFCLKNNIKSIVIYHDYKNLKLWLKNNTHIKKKEIFLYKKYIKHCRSNLIIQFKWIKSHNNNKYNDLADFLANKAYDSKAFSSVFLK